MGSALLRSSDLYSNAGIDCRVMISSTRGIVSFADFHQVDANGFWAKIVHNRISAIGQPPNSIGGGFSCLAKKNASFLTADNCKRPFKNPRTRT